MATLEELTVETTAEIEARKPLKANVNGVDRDFTDEEYAQVITDIANSKYEKQEYGYMSNRRGAYGSIGDQLDMQYHDLVDDTTTWKDHIAKVKSDNPKP